MSNQQFTLKIGRAHQLLERLSRPAEELPPPYQSKVQEVSEAISASMEDLHISAGKRDQLLSQIQGLLTYLEREFETQQTMLDNTTTRLAYLDPDFNFIRVNTAYASGSGTSQKELLSRNHFDLYPDADIQAIFERVRDTGEPAAFQATAFNEMANQPEQGATYWDWSLIPVKNEQGEVQALVISSTDVTEDVTELVKAHQELEWQEKELQRHAEDLEEMVAQRTAALRESEARFRTIFEESVLGIALLDTAGRLVASNPALQNLLGYSEEELAGMIFSIYSHPDDADADLDLYKALMSGELGHYQIEKRYVRKGGQVRWCTLTVSRVQRTTEDKSWLAVAAMEDITEKKRIQDSLLQTEKLAIAGRLGASLTHEINNPLQAVIGCLGLAEEMLEDGDDVRRYLEMAMEELERAAGILAKLRDLSRESEVEKKEPTDLNALVNKTLLLTRRNCQNRGVEVEWSPGADLSPIPLVPDRMEQVFLNLVLNAVEAMDGGGQLHVSITPTSQPEGVAISFADTGVGIELDRLEQIFEPFHSNRHEGLGLGLYICKNIVEEHGGHIKVDSRIGEGSTFTVWLPGK